MGPASGFVVFWGCAALAVERHAGVPHCGHHNATHFCKRHRHLSTTDRVNEWASLYRRSRSVCGSLSSVISHILKGSPRSPEVD